MPIPVSCPNCFADYSVPEKFLGKRVKCKACGTPIRVEANEAEVVDDSDEYESAEKPVSAKSRSRKAAAPVARTPVQRVLVWAAQHPVLAMGAVWLVWVPLSFLVPVVAAGSALLEMGLGALMMVVGMLCLVIGVAIRNPFALLAGLFGAVVAGTTGIHGAAVGRAMAEVTKNSTSVKSEYERDTGWSGTLAMLGAILMFLGVLHLVALAVSGTPINL